MLCMTVSSKSAYLTLPYQYLKSRITTFSIHFRQLNGVNDVKSLHTVGYTNKFDHDFPDVRKLSLVPNSMSFTSKEDGEPPRFVELECLTKTGEGYYEWKERSRWIKLQEDIEVGSGRWCIPYIPSLPYKAIIGLRQLLVDGDLLLDVEENTLQGVADRLCESLSQTDTLKKGMIHLFHATLLARHHHRHNPLNPRHLFRKHKNHWTYSANKLTLIHLNPEDASSSNSAVQSAIPQTVRINLLEEDNCDASRRSSVTKFMTDRSEASTILVAEVPYALKASVVFIRLRNGVVLGNLNEVSLPVKFVFLVIGPPSKSIDYLQIGRALGILMSDCVFREEVLNCTNTTDLLHGIEDYLVRSNIVPEGKWDTTIWSHSLDKWSNLVQPNPVLHHRRKGAMTPDNDNKEELDTIQSNEDQLPERIGSPFGGLLEDIKRKAPFYTSDFSDGFNAKCILAIVFVWISFFTQTITFGALLSEETGQLLGVVEMCYATFFSGIIFSLFGGQPLLILGATGPIYVMESSVFKLSSQLGVEFLTWRIWIGIWTTLLFIVIIGFDLSFLIRYITAGIEEIVTALISTVFIFESFDYIATILLEYNSNNEANNSTLADHEISNHGTHPMNRHYALPPMSIILMIGTYLSCHFIRKIRYTRFFSIYFRRLISDLGVLITIIGFVSFDIWMEDDYTPKLIIAKSFTLTAPSKRGWVINLMGEEETIKIGYILLAIIPAFLVTIVLFIETEVTGTIMDRSEHKLKKGSGYSLDLLITGLLMTFCSFFGLPWMCACQIHSILHLNSLSVLSKTHAPGTRAHIIKVIEQRLTNLMISVLIGLSIFLRPVLLLIPLAIPFGVFLYLGVTSFTYLQLVERIKLIFIPKKRHPNHRYLRKVRIKKVHLFTVVQTICLLLVMTVKNSIIAPAFPFFILMLIPLKSLLKMYFTEEELQELDGIKEEDVADDLDEYDVVRVKT